MHMHTCTVQPHVAQGSPVYGIYEGFLFSNYLKFLKHWKGILNEKKKFGGENKCNHNVLCFQALEALF